MNSKLTKAQWIFIRGLVYEEMQSYSNTKAALGSLNLKGKAYTEAAEKEAELIEIYNVCTTNILWQGNASNG